MLSRGSEMTHWVGHEATTSAALLDVIITAATGAARPSHTDRILFTACEFWASAQNCTLIEQLREDPLPQLQAAEAAFAEMGLAGVGGIVRRGRERLTDCPEWASLAQVARSIEESLADIDEPVDQRIAAYADQQARIRQHE